MFRLHTKAGQAALAYVVGALLGDGSVFQTKQAKHRRPTWMIALDAKDVEFAQKVAEQATFIIKRRNRKPFRPIRWSRNGRTYWRVQIRVESFAKYYHDLQKEEIERIAKLSPKAFLRGFFDAEGTTSPKKRQVRISNGDRGLLELCQGLLATTLFGYPNGTPIHSRIGSEWKSSQWKDRFLMHTLHIYGRDAYRFVNAMSSCIPRKRRCPRPKRHLASHNVRNELGQYSPSLQCPPARPARPRSRSGR